MSDKLIFTNLSACKSRAAALIRDNALYEVQFLDEREATCFHNIYVGKVASVSKNLQAAFIDIGMGQNCYYPLDELPFAVFTSKVSKKPLAAGDELLVQVTKEAVKTKAPVVSSRLSLAGVTCVATTAFSGIRCSVKLTEEEKKNVTDGLSACLQDFPEAEEMLSRAGLLVRTNGGSASPEEIAEEYQKLFASLQELIVSAKYRKCFSLLYTPAAAYFPALKDYPKGTIAEIVTDDETERNRLSAETDIPIRLYADKSYPLSKLYNLDKQLSDCLSPRVWLKSGAYLVIQPTEALVSVDVNTGKCEAGKNREETFFKINMEAAKEIARQIRLRRLSGIITVDFINMADRERKNQLLKYLSDLFYDDPAHPVVVDMTKLGLVEITRRKNEKSMFEYFKLCGIINGKVPTKE